MRTIISRGFTLIEMMIALAIFAFLIAIAGPQYADFMGNMQIRNGGENTLTGVRLAQAEAIRGNTQVQFVLDTTATGGWQVLRWNETTGAFDMVVQSYQWSNGASKTTVTSGGVNTVTFNGLGRIMSGGSNLLDGTVATEPIAQIDITNLNVANPRPLRVVINPVVSSGIKLCDPNPAVASHDPNDPRICPS
jgi:type IV fimbrial biogenesis protein FimT